MWSLNRTFSFLLKVQRKKRKKEALELSLFKVSEKTLDLQVTFAKT